MRPPLPDDLGQRISNHENPEHPFGPIDESRVDDPQLSALFYCAGASVVGSSELPIFLIGKSGSGKTAALRFLGRAGASGLDSGNLKYLNVRVEDLYRSIHEQLRVEGSFETTRAAALWEKLLLEMLLGAVSNSERAAASSKAGAGAGAFVNREPIRRNLREVLEATDTTLIATLDPLTRYRLADDAFVNTLVGYWRAVSQLNEVSNRVHVVTAIPFEVWSANSSFLILNRWLDISGRTSDLVWDIFGLLRVAAYRFANFLKRHSKVIYDGRELSRFSSSRSLSNDDIKKFWQGFLPESVGDPPEEPLTYICRHTQQVPRQLLAMLQNIAVLSYHRTGGWGFFPEAEIISGVARTSAVIADDVFFAFRDVYPLANAAFKSVFGPVVRDSRRSVFSYGHLEELWTDNARSIMERMNIFGFDEFIRTMQLMGIIGPFVEFYESDETTWPSTVYIAINFDQQVRIGPTDRIALHPLFAMSLGARQREQFLPAGLLSLHKS